MKKSVCIKCKKEYNEYEWGQCVINNRIEFCCVDCKEKINE